MGSTTCRLGSTRLRCWGSAGFGQISGLESATSRCRRPGVRRGRPKLCPELASQSSEAPETGRAWWTSKLGPALANCFGDLVPLFGFWTDPPSRELCFGQRRCLREGNEEVLASLSAQWSRQRVVRDSSPCCVCRICPPARAHGRSEVWCADRLATSLECGRPGPSGGLCAWSWANSGFVGTSRETRDSLWHSPAQSIPKFSDSQKFPPILLE